MKRLSIASLLIAAVAFIGLSSATPLDDYVYTDDGAFQITDLKKTLNGTTGYTVRLYNFTSQKWLTPADSSMPVWWHILAVIIPDEVDKTLDSSIIYMTGTGNDLSWLPTSDDQDISIAATLAVGTKSTAAVLYQVPCEPISFPGDPWHMKHRTEDAIIAYTWWHYATVAPDQPEWVLELPMTKAGVKALDALQIILPNYIGGIPINKFVVAGASKRGWATWLVGAVESIRPNNRVLSIIPMVLDAIHLTDFFHRQFTFYGAWTFALDEYIACNITLLLDSPGLNNVFELVDPWFYRDRLTMPKLILNAGGDEFQMPDDHRYWGHQLPGETHFLLVKNAEHTLATGLVEALSAITAWAASVQAKAVRPTVDWAIDSTGRIFVNTTVAPLSVDVTWSDSALGVSQGRRDFRWGAKGVEPCIGILGGCLRPLLWETSNTTGITFTSPTSFNALMDTIEGQWRAFTLEIRFETPFSTEPLLFTVPASVIPDTFPFPDCTGAECGTTMC